VAGSTAADAATTAPRPSSRSRPVVARHFLLALAYDGADFHGWQRQTRPDTVQGVVESTLARVLQQPVRVAGAGRTDAGVHALDQKASFSATTRLAAHDVRRALNALLPDSIRVVAAEETSERVDPRRNARRKTYVYQFHVGDWMPPERRRHYAHAGPRLDVDAMRRAARELCGEHDFTSFARAQATRRGAVRRLHAVRVRRVPSGVRLFFTGSGFLYNMVRTLASALLEVGRGRCAPESVAAVLVARDRARAPATLPARGLWLWRVDLDGANSTTS
jgi:tRNA pseudouridine38-40 synthase